MSGDTTVQSLTRLTWLPDREEKDNGNLIAGQLYYDVHFSGGDISNVTITSATIVTPIFSTPVSLANGGTGQALVDPGDDRIFFWDESAGQTDWLIPGSGLVIVDKTMTVSGVGLGDVTGPGSATDNAICRFNGTTGKVIQDSGASIDDTGNITANNLSGTNTGDQTITLTGAVTGTGTGSFATTFGSLAGLSVLGRSANSSGTPAAITAASDFQVMRRSGTSIAFGSVNLASSNAVTGALDETNGGTGLTTLTTGDIIYASAANTFSKLAIGSTGQVLTVAAGIPSWATSTVPAAATQANQETATSTTTYVSPGRQQYHPSAAKFFGYVTVSAGTPTLQTSYNITSITDAGDGLLTVTIATDFSSANWACLAFVERAGTGTAASDTRVCNMRNATQAAGSFQLECYSTDSLSLRDPAAWHFTGFGDQ